ncbi:hypothetical protein EES40_02935 [Streptomyces sp. ADI93-02]|nr:hypothetical protein EES40_02935 [Streptomyces sp. ADI93-02]
MQPGRDAAHPEVRCPFGERVDELVAAAPVAQPHRPYVPVVRPRDDELRERQLVRDAGHPVEAALRLADLLHQVLGQHHPGQPQPGRQGLAGRPQVDDPLRVEALERAHRLTVVAELAVVVVLQDQTARGPRPVDRRGPPVGVQRDAGGELVGGGQQHRARTRCSRQRPGPRPERVDRDARGAQARVGQEVPVDVQPVRLDGHPPHPVTPQHLPHQREPVDEPGADHDALRVRVHPARPCQVVRQRAPQLDPAARIVVSEGRVGGGGEAAPGGPEPFGTGEGGEVGRPRHQVVEGAPAHLPATGAPGGRPRRAGPLRDPGPRTLPCGEPALGHELGIGVGDGVTGDPEVRGERPGGGQAGAGRQPPGAHRLPQRVHQPAAQARADRFDVQVGTESGPGICHGNGPYRCAIPPIASNP